MTESGEILGCKNGGFACDVKLFLVGIIYLAIGMITRFTILFSRVVINLSGRVKSAK